ncbi:MAG: leucine-rich repeat protein [Muribaculaceae bacterium]|nr:leucine-rich repeat protein [Muribaculaceae bacterium]
MRQKFLLMLMVLICYASASLGQTTFIVDDLTYSIKSEEEKTCAVDKCPEDKIDVVIPQEVTYNGTGYKVVEIGNFAFDNCGSLESVSLPDGLLSIGGGTFWGCRNLKSINLPEGLLSIGNFAFDRCSALSIEEFPKTLTNLGESVFSGCKSLISFNWPSTLTSVPKNTFSSSGLIYIDLPNTVTSIGGGAFSGCKGLVSINLPEGLTSINNSAFSECEALKSIELPSSLTSIEGGAFYGCTGLASIELPSSITSIELSTFNGCTGLASIELPSSLTSIGNLAFNGCTGLTYIELPSSLTSIGGSAFYGCTGLASIELPTSLTSIEKSAFSDCIGLTSINFPASLTSIGDFSFCRCTGLTSIDIPSTLTSIGVGAFEDCSNVITLNMEAPMTYVGGRAFTRCRSLKNIVYKNEWRNYELCSGVFPNDIETFIYDSNYIREYPLDIFTGSISPDATLYVPNNEIEWVKNNTPWNEFKNIMALPEMSLNSEHLELWTGKNEELTVNLDTEEMPFGKVEVEWSSSDNDVVAIEGAGNNVELVPLADGYSVVSCQLKWGEVWTKTLECNVFVKETLKDIKIVADKDTISKGQSLILSAVSEPVNAYYKDSLTWKSSDESIAQVLPSTNGRALVKGLKAGTATITAEAGSKEEGGYAQDSIEITVTQPVESIYLDPVVWEGVEGQTLQLTVTILPEDATDKTLEWSSSDDEIATVDETGLVSVLKEGNCVITARTTDGSDLTAECHISITTGMEEILFDSNATVDVFTLDGVKIKSDCKRNSLDDLTSGIYLLRKGNKVEKLIIH